MHKTASLVYQLDPTTASYGRGTRVWLNASIQSVNLPGIWAECFDRSIVEYFVKWVATHISSSLFNISRNEFRQRLPLLIKGLTVILVMLCTWLFRDRAVHCVTFVVSWVHWQYWLAQIISFNNSTGLYRLRLFFIKINNHWSCDFFLFLNLLWFSFPCF